MNYSHQNGPRGAARAAVSSTLLASVVAIAGCAYLLGVESDRHLAEIDAGGSDAGEPSGPWDCINNAPEVTSTTANVTVSLNLYDPTEPSVTAAQIDGGSQLDTITSDALAGVQVNACPSLASPSCDDALGPVLSNDAGTATFTLVDSFNGLFTLRRPDLVPYTLFPGNLPANVTSVQIPAPLLSKSSIALLGLVLPANYLVTPSIGGADAGATDGMVFFSVFDCHDHFAPGVSLTLDPPGGNQTFVYYATLNDFISVTATYTSSVASGGFMNITPGATTISAQIAVGSLKGTSLGSVAVVVTPGAVAQVNFRERTH